MASGTCAKSQNNTRKHCWLVDIISLLVCKHDNGKYKLQLMFQLLDVIKLCLISEVYLLSLCGSLLTLLFPLIPKLQETIASWCCQEKASSLSKNHSNMG